MEKSERDNRAVISAGRRDPGRFTRDPSRSGDASWAVGVPEQPWSPPVLGAETVN